jgi:hypothetical protein
MTPEDLVFKALDKSHLYGLLQTNRFFFTLFSYQKLTFNTDIYRQENIFFKLHSPGTKYKIRRILEYLV